MREGKFFEINKKPTNYFLEKDKAADPREFEYAVKGSENFFVSGRGDETVDWLSRNSVEIGPEREKVLLEVLEAANKVIQNYSGKNIQLTRSQIVVVPYDALASQYSEAELSGSKVGGATIMHLQKVVVGLEEHGSNSEFADEVFHELMHLGSFSRIRYSAKNDDPVMGNYHAERAGLKVLYRDGSEKFFGNLDEALTQELSIRYLKSQRDNPLYKKDFERGEETFGNEIEGGVLTYGQDDQGNSVPVMSHAYRPEIAAATEYIEGLYNENRDRFKSPEEVWEVFFQAKFTGRLLSLARLIEKTHGKGKFRTLGEVSNEPIE